MLGLVYGKGDLVNPELVPVSADNLSPISNAPVPRPSRDEPALERETWLFSSLAEGVGGSALFLVEPLALEGRWATTPSSSDDSRAAGATVESACDPRRFHRGREKK